MAVCTWCRQEMTTPAACTQTVYDDFPDGVTRERIPYPADADQPCHDCYAPPGALHHPGCDDERCPRCRGQAIGCSCTDGEEDDDKPPAPIRFFAAPEPDPTPQPKPGDVVVVYRESDRLLADAFDTDVPLLAWGRIPETES